MIKTNKKRVFLDHDGTLTYQFVENNQEYDRYKNGLKEFLQFLVENFEVMWCSGLGEDTLIHYLQQEKISKDILDKIKYFDFSFIRGKANSIMEKTKEFILIDDDYAEKEYEMLKDNGIENNLIKSNCKDPDDLFGIIEKLKKIL